MSEDSSVLYCSNCLRDIPTNNYEMHVVHCKRNIQLCPKCQEPVPHSQLESHDSENHAIVKCNDCLKSMENSLLDGHEKNECIKRQQTCQYCDLELEADRMHQHIEYCGARTESCEVCRQLIMLKYQQFHEESGHRKTKPDEVVVLDDTDEEDDDDGLQASGWSNARRVPENNLGELDWDMNNTLDREPQVVNLDLDEELQNLDLDHARNTATVRPFAVTGRVNRGDGPARSLNWEEETLIPCEFCSMPIIANQLVKHQTGCRPDSTSFPGASKMREDRENDLPHRNGSQSRSRNISVSGMMEEGAIMIPCEFCQKLFDLDFLDRHQSSCQNHGAAGAPEYFYVDDD